MKILNFLKTLFALMVVSVSCFTTTIANNTHAHCEVVFKINNIKSSISMLSIGKKITAQEAFGAHTQLPENYTTSVMVKFLTKQEFSVYFENVHDNTHITLLLPEAFEAQPNAIERKNTTYWEYIASMGGLITYYGSMAAMAPCGAVLAAAKGAELGGIVGVQIMKQTVANLHPLVAIIEPLLLTGASSMGIAGGYALGAASGAIMLPLVFAAGYHMASIIFCYERSNANYRESPIEDLLESNWVLLENPDRTWE